jgi:7,8-dihydro-6-hydroxymethylpterin-pyrophosphokinase
MRHLDKDFTNIECSALYQSDDSQGRESKYWNLAVGFNCFLTPTGLIKRLKHIEKLCGRHHPALPSGQIPLDLDLVFLLVGTSLNGEVEHCLDYSFIKKTSYFVIPLANLYPFWSHPDTAVDLATTVINMNNLSPQLEKISDVF